MVDYNEYMQSPEWDVVRRNVLDRANGTCERCGERGKLSVHHPHYESLGQEDPRELEALCDECHGEADQEREAEVEDRATERQDEFEEELWDARLDGWASQVFGLDWREWQDCGEVEERFIAWLSAKGEDIPEHRRRRLFKTRDKRSPISESNFDRQDQLASPQPEAPAAHSRVTMSMVGDFQSCPFKFYRTYVESPRRLPIWRSFDLGFANFFRSEIAGAFNRIGIGSSVAAHSPLLRVESVQGRFVKTFFPTGKLQHGFRICGFDRQADYERKLANLVSHVNRHVEKQMSGHMILAVDRQFSIDTDFVPIHGVCDLVTRSSKGSLVVRNWRTGKKARDHKKQQSDELRAILAAIWARREFEAEVKDSLLVFLIEPDYWKQYGLDVISEKFALKKLSEVHRSMVTTSDHSPTTSPLCDWCEWKTGCPAFA